MEHDTKTVARCNDDTQLEWWVVTVVTKSTVDGNIRSQKIRVRAYCEESTKEKVKGFADKMVQEHDESELFCIDVKRTGELVGRESNMYSFLNIPEI